MTRPKDSAREVAHERAQDVPTPMRILVGFRGAVLSMDPLLLFPAGPEGEVLRGWGLRKSVLGVLGALGAL